MSALSEQAGDRSTFREVVIVAGVKFNLRLRQTAEAFAFSAEIATLKRSHNKVVYEYNMQSACF